MSLPAAESSLTPNLIALSEVQPERVQWLSPGRLAAGKLTILDGDPGLGKSTLICDWAARISRGDALPGGQPDRPRGVVILSAEDGLADTLRPRCDAAGADVSKILALRTVPDGTPEGRLPALPGDLDAIERVVTRYDVALVVIDPLVAYLDGALNAYRDQDVRRALAPLASMAERTGAAVLAIRHLNKLSQGTALYRGGGSIGIIGAARCGLVLAADPDDPTIRVLAPTKSNLALHPPALAFRLVTVEDSDVARVDWLGESTRRADDLLRDDPEHRTERDEAKAWLRDTLKDGPVAARKVEEMAKRAGISSRTLRRAREELRIQHKRREVSGGYLYFWSLKGANEAASTEVGHPSLFPKTGQAGQPGQKEIPMKGEQYHGIHQEVDQVVQTGQFSERGRVAIQPLDDTHPTDDEPGQPSSKTNGSSADSRPALEATGSPSLTLILGGKDPRMQGTPPGVPLPRMNPALPPSMQTAPWETKAALNYLDDLSHVCEQCGTPLPRDRTRRCYTCLPKGGAPAELNPDDSDDALSFLDNEIWSCVSCGQPLPGNRRYQCYDCHPKVDSHET